MRCQTTYAVFINSRLPFMSAAKPWVYFSEKRDEGNLLGIIPEQISDEITGDLIKRAFDLSQQQFERPKIQPIPELDNITYDNYNKKVITGTNVDSSNKWGIIPRPRGNTHKSPMNLYLFDEGS